MMILLTFLFSGIFILLVIILGFKWKKLQLFFHDGNYTYFDMAFLSIYFLEQAVFIVISYFYKDYNILLTGFFAMVVITTISAQKIMMESKSRKISEYSADSVNRLRIMREEYEEQLASLDDYIRSLEKDNLYFKKFIKKNLQ